MKNLTISLESSDSGNSYEERTIKNALYLTYSPNGNSFVYAVKKDGKRFVVKDGVEGNMYDYAYDLTYSPNSNSFSYEAKKDGKWFVVKDGVVGGCPYFNVLPELKLLCLCSEKRLKTVCSKRLSGAR